MSVDEGALRAATAQPSPPAAPAEDSRGLRRWFGRIVTNGDEPVLPPGHYEFDVGAPELFDREAPSGPSPALKAEVMETVRQIDAAEQLVKVDARIHKWEVHDEDDDGTLVAEIFAGDSRSFPRVYIIDDNIDQWSPVELDAFAAALLQASEQHRHEHGEQ